MRTPLQAITELAPITLRLCQFLLLSAILSLFLPGLLDWTALQPCENNLLLRISRLPLYSIAVGGLYHWFLMSVALLLAGLVSERFLGWKALVALWFISTFVGGSAYIIAADSCIPFIGPGAFAWALAGAALIVVPSHWNRAHILEKIYFYGLIVSVCSMIGQSPAATALQMSGLLLGIAVTYFLYRKRHGVDGPSAGTAA